MVRWVALLAALVAVPGPAWSTEPVPEAMDALSEAMAASDRAMIRERGRALRALLGESGPEGTPRWDEAWDLLYEGAFAAAEFPAAGRWAVECARTCLSPDARLQGLDRADRLDAVRKGEVLGIARELELAGVAGARDRLVAAAGGAQLAEMHTYLAEHGPDPEASLLFARILLLRREVIYLPDARALLVEARDQVEPDSELARRLRRHSRALNDHHSWCEYLAVQFPLEGSEVEGVALTRRRDWRVGTQRTWFGRVLTTGAFTRTKWRAMDLEEPVIIGTWRWTMAAGVDLLHLPVWWRFRPALVPYAGAGVGWGSRRRRGEDGSALATDGFAGPTAAWGVDLHLHARFKEVNIWQLRVGLARDVTWIQEDGAWGVPDHDWPWQLRIEIATGLYLGSRAELVEAGDEYYETITDIIGGQALYDLVP